jgi:Leishmanolysin
VPNGFFRVWLESDATLNGMQTLFTRIGSVFIMALALAACGQNPVTPPAPPPPPPATAYNISLAFGSSISNQDKAIFATAASRWQQVITNDLPDVTGTVDITLCDPQLTGFPSVNSVDDLVIFADVSPIDGPGGTLAQAGPCATRQSGTQLPGVGIMQFDSADVADLRTQGHLTETITHEMGHVIGFGTLWKAKGGFLTGAGASGACGNAPTYIKANAKTEYATLGGSGNVPIEGSADGSGPGSCDSHWRESVFGTELMTPSIDTSSPAANPLSRLSIAAMADLGYQVNLNAAEGFNLAAIGSILPSSSRVLLREKLITPRFELLGTQRIPLR